MLAACPPVPAIVAQANRRELDIICGQQLYRSAYGQTVMLGFPAGWLAACKTASTYRARLVRLGVRSRFALSVLMEWASLYASAVYGIPVSCWEPGG